MTVRTPRGQWQKRDHWSKLLTGGSGAARSQARGGESGRTWPSLPSTRRGTSVSASGGSIGASDWPGRRRPCARAGRRWSGPGSTRSHRGAFRATTRVQRCCSSSTPQAVQPPAAVVWRGVPSGDASGASDDPLAHGHQRDYVGHERTTQPEAPHCRTQCDGPGVHRDGARAAAPGAGLFQPPARRRGEPDPADGTTTTRTTGIPLITRVGRPDCPRSTCCGRIATCRAGRLARARRRVPAQHPPG